MTIGPQQFERRKGPQESIGIEDADEQSRHEEGKQSRAIGREIDSERSSGESGTDAEVEVGAARGQEPGQSTEGGQQRRADQDDPRETSRPIDAIKERLRQPLVREIEMADAGLARIGGRIQGGAEGEWIGNWKGVALNDILAGLQMPPEIGVGDFGAEEADQYNGGQQSGQNRQPGWNPKGPGCGCRGGWSRLFGSLTAVRGCRGTRPAHNRARGVEGGSKVRLPEAELTA